MGLKKIGKGLKKVNNAVLKPIEREVVRPVVKEVVKPVVTEVVQPVVQAVVEHSVLPAVIGVAGRRKATSNHVITDFQRESIQLIVTAGGEVEIQEVASPCPGGDHNIVPCQQPLEIQLNDGSFIFNDKFCTKCGEHFPFLPESAEQLPPTEGAEAYPQNARGRLLPVGAEQPPTQSAGQLPTQGAGAYPVNARGRLF